MQDMQKFLSITKALSDENRVRVLMFLKSGELCVCQIIEMLGLAPSTVSKHMSILHQAGLVTTHKDGRWVFYGLPGDDAPGPVRAAIELVQSSLQNEPTVCCDSDRLATVRNTNRDELCCHYRPHSEQE
ncbi:MAG: winged helix-turn-helix transcriptional regulator [Phycisphaerales bacterium]|jgi:ArsR family transcriptional regulator, arsenate/arsenite/antimonite-responsive transcriptional repressor|nr:winged helix-turn-helix transcriptional regulator [Phycisphaerales bacterium]